MYSTIYIGLLCSLAAPSLGMVWESLGNAIPSSWSLVDMPSGESTMSLSIALTRQNIGQLESKLSKLSTPGSPQYGQWLDKNDIDSQFPVVDDTKVVNWLQSAGISNMAREGGMLNFAASVDTVNKLLNTNFAYYKKGNSVKLRTHQYSIPDNLSNYIDLISPTVYFGNVHAASPAPSRPQEFQTRGSATTVSPSCQTSITPSCLKEMYNVGHYTPQASSGSRVGFGSFLNQSAQLTDLADYEAFFNIPSQSFTVQTINGGVNDQNATLGNVVEADLDVELIVGVSHPLPVHEYITGGSPPFIPDADEPITNTNEPYLPYYEFLLRQPNNKIPQVISNSYGDDEQTVPPKYAQRVCNLIGLNTMRGISILESSGDEGVGSACQASDHTTPQFNPIFPATCPFVTSVGGTSAVTPEVAWDGSSGGFSNYFSRAFYQESAVMNYLSHVSPDTKQYYGQFTNFSGRAFPDVAAHSLTPDFQVIYKGHVARSGGTSAASPTFAAIIGLLNDARLRAGKPALGFLNPFLYNSGFKALNDITSGSSFGCTGIDPQTGQPVPGGLVIPGAHWNATRGWDPVTGLGTPNFQKLKSLVMAL